MNQYIAIRICDIFKCFCLFFTKNALAINTLAVQLVVYLDSLDIIHILYSTASFAEAIIEKLYRFIYSKRLLWIHLYFVSNLYNSSHRLIKIAEKQIKKKNYYILLCNVL